MFARQLSLLRNRTKSNKIPQHSNVFFPHCISARRAHVWKCHSDTKITTNSICTTQNLCIANVFDRSLCFRWSAATVSTPSRAGIDYQTTHSSRPLQKPTTLTILKRFAMRFRRYSGITAGRYFYIDTIYLCPLFILRRRIDCLSNLGISMETGRCNAPSMIKAKCMAGKSGIMFSDKPRKEETTAMSLHEGESISFNIFLFQKRHFSNVCFPHGDPTQTTVARATIFVDAESPLFTNMQKEYLLNQSMSNQIKPT